MYGQVDFCSHQDGQGNGCSHQDHCFGGPVIALVMTWLGHGFMSMDKLINVFIADICKRSHAEKLFQNCYAPKES